MNMFSNQRNPERCRFSLPNDVWKWDLKPQGFAIFAYLCYLHIHFKKDGLRRKPPTGVSSSPPRFWLSSRAIRKPFLLNGCFLHQ